MKKIIIKNQENETLFYGINELDCGWMLTTAGDPVTRLDYENGIDSGENVEELEKELAEIENLIKLDGGDICTKEDIEYIEKWLDIWNI